MQRLQGGWANAPKVPEEYDLTARVICIEGKLRHDTGATSFAHRPESLRSWGLIMLPKSVQEIPSSTRLVQRVILSRGGTSRTTTNPSSS